MSSRHALLMTMLLGLPVSPLFAWDALAESLQRELGSGTIAPTTVFSVGLAAFMTSVLAGGRLADSISSR